MIKQVLKDMEERMGQAAILEGRLSQMVDAYDLMHTEFPFLTKGHLRHMASEANKYVDECRTTLRKINGL